MAVLHHAFKCSINPAVEREVSEVLRAWQAGDRERLSYLANNRYEVLTNRHDIHSSFHLGPDGAAPSWLQPRFISPGLAAFVLIAGYFQPLPSLSAHEDSNHARLARYLPPLGWSAEEIAFLINGRPIETMLHTFAPSTMELLAGGFAHTGGWTPPDIATKLRAKLEMLISEPPPATDEKAYDAWNALSEAKALEDAVAMLEPLHSHDWLVMSITH